MIPGTAGGIVRLRIRTVNSPTLAAGYWAGLEIPGVIMLGLSKMP